MSFSDPLRDSVPAISVTSPEPSDPTRSPAALEALDDSRLTPVPPMPKPHQDQRTLFINSSDARRGPMSASNNSFPRCNSQSRFFSEGTNLQQTHSNFHAGCSVHSSSSLNQDGKKKDSKRKYNPDEEDGKSKNKAQEQAIPSFSSPWGPSSCSPKRVLWKEVEDYNRQRKRVKFLGWSGVDNPWETEASSTICSEGSDCSDTDEPLRQAILSRVASKNHITDSEEGSAGIKRGELGNGIKVTISTSKDGTTTTTLQVSANARLENGVEIVTKTVVRGDEVTTVTTTTLIPLAVRSVTTTTGG
jgi:hypothetical protein